VPVCVCVCVCVCIKESVRGIITNLETSVVSFYICRFECMIMYLYECMFFL